VIGGHHPISVALATSSGVESRCLTRAKRLDRIFTGMIYENLRQPSWPSVLHTGMIRAAGTALNAIAIAGMGGSAPWSNSIEVPWEWSLLR
jgi:hypothetical protein